MESAEYGRLYCGYQIACWGLGVQRSGYMRPLICLIFSGLLLNGPLAAKHWHEDQKHWNKHANHDDNDDHGYKHQAKGCYFEPRETRVITQYYAPRRSELPPGLQKK